MKVAYFLSHPIQYQTPMLREFAAAGLEVITVYGDVSTAGAYFDRDYQQVISWEQPLLEGYSHEVLEAPTWDDWPWAWKKVAEEWMKRSRPDVVWVHGWGTAFALGALMAAHACGVPILLRGETHLGCLKPGIWWRWLHRAVLSRVFTQVDQFLAIGSANREFYRSYGVAEDRISLVPYVTDNAHFQRACQAAAAGREEFRRSLGLEPGRPVLLFIGRLSWEKNLPTLFEAMRLLQMEVPQESRPCLLIGGEGPLSTEMRAMAAERAGEDVRFLGFTQQSRLPALFDVSDALVLPSRIEPWGMVVNEAMNAGLPLILSDRVGSGDDLLRHGENGVVFETMNPRSLADAAANLDGFDEVIEATLAEGPPETGDCFKVLHEGRELKVRLLWVVCAPVKSDDNILNTMAARFRIDTEDALAVGRAAQEFTAGYLRGKKLRLVARPMREGADELEALVFLPDVGLFQNVLLDQGLAALYVPINKKTSVGENTLLESLFAREQAAKTRVPPSGAWALSHDNNSKK
jgi:glycosyltransferase involved in cell wall biosynthesis